MTNRDILNHGAIIALTSLLASCASVDRAPETLRPGVTQDYYSAHETDYLTSLATLPETPLNRKMRAIGGKIFKTLFLTALFMNR